MAAPGVQYKQDLPPSGGYRPIDYKRVPARTYFSGWAIIGGYFGITTVSVFLYYIKAKAIRARDLEMHCANLAIFPMLIAERDRELLKQVRRNRDEETKLMANVEGWKTGTWYGEPVYHTRKDKWHNLRAFEYYVHAPYKAFRERMSVETMG